MTTEQKSLIAKEVFILSSKTSQSKVAKKAGVSTATISQMVNNNWDLIRAEMWRKVQVTLKIDLEWVTAETANLKIVTELAGAAQSKGMSIGISYNAGAGKSQGFRFYEKSQSNVILIECKNYWTKKSYVKNLLTTCGLDAFGTVEELIERFLDHIRSLDNPLLIIDQFDKLKDPSLDLFMDFYNDLDGHCGIVVSGVPALAKRIRKGVQADKIGYRELWSRIGRKWIALDPVSLKDVTAICTANGLNDTERINEIFNTCEGDLRRVKRDVQKYFLEQSKAA